ncbi:MAG: hypothetical protein EOP06_17525 [Proteobacteria bacterium]|nr:MAG: hypothetical protein EOP06_17525 [Pseudomonadota bacterium]
MKMFIALASVLLSATAFATTPVRQSGPIVVDPASRAAIQPVVVMTVGSGFVPRGMITSTKLTLGDDGSVEVTEYRYNEAGQSTSKTYDSLWYFEMDVMSKVEAAYSKLQQPAKLVDTNPKAPSYADGLFISVAVVKGGKELVVARSSGGHDFLPATSTQARPAKYLLKNMMNLYNAIAVERQ